MRNLKKLGLEKNVIHLVNNLTFKYLYNLTELNLSDNLLTLLKPGTFSALVNLTKLNLEMNPIATLHIDCFIGLDQLSYLKIQNKVNQIEMYQLSVEKKLFLPKLDSIIFDHDVAEFIRLFDLTRIQKISLDNCEIDVDISRQLNFKDMKQIYLQNLRLLGNLSFYNYISDFGEYLLEIDLSFNSIDFKEPNQFISKSKNLEKLWMAGVNITCFEKALNLGTFKKLVLLDLSYNMMDIIRTDYLKTTPELKYLNLSHNRICQLQDYSFFSNSKLTVLDLSNNQIEILSDDVLPVLSHDLVELYLNNNRLRLFCAEYRFGSRFSLIRLDNNNLTAFPTSIYWVVQYLDELNLSGNRIESLGPNYFKITNRIYRLFLKNCSISTILDKTFEKVHTLNELDISHNNLTFIDNSMLIDLNSLQILNISYNKIKFIQNASFQELNRLTSFDLRNNRIHDIEDDAFLNLNSLKSIYLDNNPIIYLFKNNTFTGLFQLKHMSIPDSVKMSLDIARSIVNQIKLRIVRQVLNITFYDSIEISYPPNNTTKYTSDMCFYISYFIRNQITFNLEDEDNFYVYKYLNDCKDWSTDHYQATLA
jgi:Leucine-rich repeat (LRR) protein